MDLWDLYRSTLVPLLQEDHFDRRIEMLKKVISSDDATFLLIAHVNLQTCHHWATKISHWMQDYNTQYRKKLNI